MNYALQRKHDGFGTRHIKTKQIYIDTKCPRVGGKKTMPSKQDTGLHHLKNLQ